MAKGDAVFVDIGKRPDASRRGGVEAVELSFGPLVRLIRFEKHDHTRKDNSVFFREFPRAAKAIGRDVIVVRPGEPSGIVEKAGVAGICL